MNKLIVKGLQFVFLFILLCQSASSFGVSACYDQAQYPSLTPRAVLDSLILRSTVGRTEIEKNQDSLARIIICLGKELGDDVAVAGGESTLALDYYIKGQFEEAFKWAYSSLYKSQSLDNTDLMIQNHNLLGLLYEDINHFEVAASFFVKLKNMSEQSNDIATLCSVLLNLSTIQYKVGDPQKAFDSVKKVEELLIEYEDSIHQETFLWSYKHIGELYFQQGDTSAAFDYFNKALRIGKELKFDRGLDWIKLSMLLSYMKVDFDKAISLYDEAQSTPSEHRNIRLSTSYDLVKAKMLSRQNKHNEAISVLENSLTKISKTQLFNYQKKILNKLIQLYDKTHHISQKVIHQKMLIEITDNKLKEIRGQSFSIWMTNLEQLSQQQKDVQQLELIKIAQEKWVNQLSLMIAVAVFLLILLGTFVFFFRKLATTSKHYAADLLVKNNAIQNQMDTIEQNKVELEAKSEMLEKERATLKQELRKKIIYIANNKELLDRIAKVSNDLPIDANSKKKITKLIDQHLREDIWDEFDEDLAKSNELFFKKLSQINNKLTVNDYRIAALCKMNLSSKEIARLLSKSVESIHMAKSRLREKLNVKSKDSTLVSFFNNIEAKN